MEGSLLGELYEIRAYLAGYRQIRQSSPKHHRLFSAKEQAADLRVHYEMSDRYLIATPQASLKERFYAV